MLLLLQNCPPDYDIAAFPDWIETSKVDGQISLSAARNRLLDYAIANRLVSVESIYGFPDDDCWYPENLLSLVSSAFASDQQLEFWFCRYGSSPQVQDKLQANTVVLQKVISRASSNTFFFRGRLITGLGHFDESLGVGAALNGGEDTEYAIRAYYTARKTLFSDSPLVGHRDPDPNLRPKYFPGTLRAISRHRHRSILGLTAYVRKLLVGLALVVRGRMKPFDYISAIRSA
ncbi:hypothetical protein DTW90_37000 [Neorhizobium sp. P12A]|nr:hypothetical protein DTW90_37000 [Neorhizobium sp. P12A]